MTKINKNISEENVFECLYCPYCNSKDIKIEYPSKDEEFLFNYKIKCNECNKDSKVFNDWFKYLFWYCKKCESHNTKRKHLGWFQPCIYECIDCKEVLQNGWLWSRIDIISDYVKNQYTIEQTNEQLKEITNYLNYYILWNYWEDAKFYHSQDLAKFYRTDYYDDDFSEMCKNFTEYYDFRIAEDVKYIIFLLKEYWNNNRKIIDNYFKNITSI